MMKKSGLSASKLSLNLGKSRAYIASMLSHGSVPKVDTMARIAHECNYQLVLKSDDDEIELYSKADSMKFALDQWDKLRERDGIVWLGTYADALKTPEAAYESRLQPRIVATIRDADHPDGDKLISFPITNEGVSAYTEMVQSHAADITSSNIIAGFDDDGGHLLYGPDGKPRKPGDIADSNPSPPTT